MNDERYKLCNCGVAFTAFSFEWLLYDICVAWTLQFVDVSVCWPCSHVGNSRAPSRNLLGHFNDFRKFTPFPCLPVAVSEFMCLCYIVLCWFKRIRLLVCWYNQTIKERLNVTFIIRFIVEPELKGMLICDISMQMQLTCLLVW